MIGFSKPVSATYLGLPAIILAMDTDHVYLVDADGKIAKVTFDIVNVDWKYDYENDCWVDYGPLPEGMNAESEEETDDGGPEVSGRLPDADGAGGSDPSDQENGETRSLDSGEENRGEE